MRKAAVDVFLSDNSVYICTENAVIRGMNSPAKAIGRFSVGDSLFDCMSPQDCLRYEMMWEVITEKPPLAAVLTSGGEKLYAAFFFEDILGKKFTLAVVSDTEKSPEKMLDVSGDTVCPVTPMALEIIEALLDIPDENFGKCDDAEMYKIPAATERVIKDIRKNKRFFDCEVALTMPKDGLSGCSGMGLGNFVRCFSIVMYMANGLSCDKLVSVEVVRNGTVPSVVTTVQVDRMKFPSPTVPALTEDCSFISVAMSLCEFCAGCAGYNFSAVDLPGKVALILERDNRELTEIELKSRKCFENYGKYTESAQRIFRFLAAQKKDQ